MCKLTNYKLVRQQADKLVGHISRNQYLNYIEADNNHDMIITKEAIYAYLPLCYDVITKISRRPTIDVFEDFIQSFEEDLLSHSFVDIILEYKEIYDKYIDLLSRLETGYHIFDPKSSLRSIIWWYERGLFNIPLQDREYYELHTELAAQVLLFLSKLEYEGEKDRLETEAIAKWYEAERRNMQQDRLEANNEFYDYIYSLLEVIIGYWFGPKKFKFNLDECCNGSGAVNIDSEFDVQRDAPANKWVNFAVPMTLKHVIDNMLTDRTLEEINPLYVLCEHKPISRFITVPKNCTSRRAISTEPPAFQFLQQGMRKSVYKYFKKCRNAYRNAIGNFVYLEDNTFNKALAQVGSILDDFETIDLSSASDSVRVSSVKKLFKKQYHVLKWLLATRTDYINIAGKVVKVAKFAGMGSGNCFWVETVVFASIALLGSMYDRSQILNKWVAPNDIKRKLRTCDCPCFLTYGDDIIVTKSAANTVVWLLEILGFKVNHNKSFLRGHFKESCGGNYFFGHDITPIKWRPSFGSQKIIGHEAFSALISYANLAYKHKYPTLREHCIKRLITSGNLPEFTDDIEDNSKIFSKQPTNFHLKENKKMKRRVVPIYGEKRENRGLPIGIEFRYRKLLYRRIKYTCTSLKVIKPTDFDINDIEDDIRNSLYYQVMINGNMKHAFRDKPIKKCTATDILQQVLYLEQSVASGGESYYDIRCDKHYSKVRRTYHLTPHNTSLIWGGKSQTKLGYGYFEV